jgi:plasmid stabilization system protein ParE
MNTTTGRDSSNEAFHWLANFSPDAAIRFGQRLKVELDELCRRWGEGFRPTADEAATLYYSRPVFQHVFATGRRQRRDNAGTWRVYYDILDADGDGAPDTLRFLAVRYAAARPLSLEEE